MKKEKAPQIGIQNGCLALLLLFFLFFAIGITGCNENEDTGRDKDHALRILPRPGSIYLGRYDWASAPNTFQTATGHEPVLVYAGCLGGVEGQPIFADRSCLNEIPPDRIPQLGIEAAGLPETVDEIIAGAIDDDLKQVAEVLSDWGRPLFWLYQREPSIQFPGYGPAGQLFAWDCIEENGCSRTTHFGDPDQDDGAERFIALHRRIHDVLEARIAKLGRRSNLTYVMGAIVDNWKPGTYTLYYPGDDYVDWHALDVYHGIEEEGAVQCNEGWDELVKGKWSEAMDLAPGKPMMIVEFGSHPANCDRVAFFEDFFHVIDENDDYKALGAIWYWQADPFYLGLPGSDSASDLWRSELADHPDRWSNCAILSDGSELGPGC